MKFERLFLTKSAEFYRFTVDYNDVAYLLLEDTFSKAPMDFGKRFLDDDFEPRENQILVKVGERRALTDEEREFILSFLESLLNFKPSLDYVADVFPVNEDIESDYPDDRGFLQLIEIINRLFGSNISITHPGSFNNLMQY